MFESFIISLLDDAAQKIRLIVTPAVIRESDFFETQPLEHTYLSINTRN